jgi:hypothetical protein
LRRKEFGSLGEKADRRIWIADRCENQCLLSFVGADEFAFVEDVSFHGLKQLVFG